MVIFLSVEVLFLPNVMCGPRLFLDLEDGVICLEILVSCFSGSFSTGFIFPSYGDG